MFPTKALLSLLLVTVSFSAAKSVTESGASKISLPVAAKLNTAGSAKIADIDRARVAALRQNALDRANIQSKRDGISYNITNAASSQIYTASVGVGSPPTNYTLIIDTGSANTWIGAGKPYVPTSTSHDTGNAVASYSTFSMKSIIYNTIYFQQLEYGSGNFTGEEYLGTVTLAPGLVIANQSVDVATTTFGFAGVDGILGLEPQDLTYYTTANTPSVPTVSDNLLSQGVVKTETIGVFFAPATSDSNTNGELTFGGTDSTKYTGSIKYTPITNVYPSSTYFGIGQTITYANSTVSELTFGIVDTGTTLVLIASDAFAVYKNATGGVFDNSTGLLAITSEQYRNLQNLDFNVNGETYSLTPNAQIWSRALNSAIGGIADNIYLIDADIGTPTGTGLDFVNGYTFLERSTLSLTRATTKPASPRPRSPVRPPIK